MKAKKLSFIAGLSIALSLFGTPGIIASAADKNDDDLLYSAEFEKKVGEWAPFGGNGILSIDTSVKHGGKSSLKITDRVKTFNSPSVVLDAYVEENETYRLTGWIYHEGSKTETLKCIIKFGDSLDTPTYKCVAEIEAPPKEWTYFEGTVDSIEDLSTTLLYMEADNTALSYNIDDICFYGKAPTAQTNKKGEKIKFQSKTTYNFNFEKGNDSWGPRGDMRLIRTDEYSHSEPYSVLASNRTKQWNGPTVAINDIERGSDFNYSAYVMFNEKKVEDTHKFLLQLQYTLDGEEHYEVIAEKDVNKNEWTELSGVFNIPENAANVMLYIQTDNPEEGKELTESDLMSFYVDDVYVIRSDLMSNKKLIVYIIIAVIVGLVAMIAISNAIKKSLASHSSDDENKSDSPDVSDIIDLSEKNKEPEQKPVVDEKPKEPESKPAEDIFSEIPLSAKNSNTNAVEKKEEEEEEEQKEASISEIIDERLGRDIFNIKTFSYDETPDKTIDPLDTAGNNVNTTEQLDSDED